MDCFVAYSKKLHFYCYVLVHVNETVAEFPSVIHSIFEYITIYITSPLVLSACLHVPLYFV